ncbi:hypothetical protein [Candidatus Lokiarchaeum ossiferum]|uniref:hypothetical protein n=1 Tax=Candidatus Lokiarchaeum ossiferum TaxID=2951803 RepID=UPI00352DFC63
MFHFQNLQKRGFLINHKYHWYSLFFICFFSLSSLGLSHIGESNQNTSYDPFEIHDLLFSLDLNSGIFNQKTDSHITNEHFRIISDDAQISSSLNIIDSTEKIVALIFIIILLIIIIALIAKPIHLRFIQNYKQRKLWQKFLREYQSQLSQIQNLCQTSNFNEALSLYQYLRSKIHPSCIKPLDQYLQQVLKELNFNIRIINKMNQIRTFLDDHRFLKAYLKINAILIEIERTGSALLHDHQLLTELQAKQTEIELQIKEIRQEIREKFDNTSYLIQSSQFDQVYEVFSELKQILKQWPFYDLEKELNNRYHAFINYKETFHLSKKDSISDYLKELDDDFDEWTSKEASKLGKKI